MKVKSLKLPALILAIGIVLCVVAYMATGILKTPAITTHDFPYSATCEVNGETKTVEGTYRVEFKSTGRGTNPLDRYYEGYYVENPNGRPESHILAKQDGFELHLEFIFPDAFLMGDGERGEVYEEEVTDPRLTVYDAEGYPYEDEESIAKFGAKIVSFEKAQPIENRFVFKGFSYLHSDTMFATLLIGLLVILACVIFAKKEQEVSYQVLDILSIVCNVLILFLALPFATLVIWFSQIVVSGDEILYQMDLMIPMITTFTIAASIALRRKGFRKTGFFIQFIGPVLFALGLLLEQLL